MTVLDVPLDGFKRHMICDCGGEYIATSVVLDSYPPQYPHVCSECYKQTSFDRSYPCVVYVEVGK